jgi:hypothetical protein
LAQALEPGQQHVAGHAQGMLQIDQGRLAHFGQVPHDLLFDWVADQIGLAGLRRLAPLGVLVPDYTECEQGADALDNVRFGKMVKAREVEQRHGLRWMNLPLDRPTLGMLRENLNTGPIGEKAVSQCPLTTSAESNLTTIQAG